MKQKHFIDIRHAILEPTDLLECNTGGFQLGDYVCISEKIDGANAAVRYDSEKGKLACFSRKNELGYNNTNRRFWNYVQKLSMTEFMAHPDWYVYGEWLVPHTIKYDKERYNKWYVYDIYDSRNEKWLSQDIVKEFCDNAELEYIHTFYTGEFQGWDHVKTFLNSPGYGSQQEGIVIKNQTKLNDDNNTQPVYLKIVNSQFKEIQKSNHVKKVLDPQKLEDKQRVIDIADMIVTRSRVNKMLWKLIDEDVLPEKIKPEDMKIVASNLPQRIYEDCVKEHEDLVEQAGEYFGRACSSKSMFYAKQIIFGENK